MPASPQEHRPKFTMFKNHPAHPYGTPRELLRESVSAAERHYGIAYPTFRPRQGSILDIDCTRATPLRLKILIEVCEDDDNHCYCTEEPRYCCQGHCHQSAYEFTMDVDASLRAPDMIRQSGSAQPLRKLDLFPTMAPVRESDPHYYEGNQRQYGATSSANPSTGRNFRLRNHLVTFWS
jgi:hypothetical protein